MTVRRVFVEKKKGCDIEAQGLYQDLKGNLGLQGLTGVRVINRYDVAGISAAEYLQARTTIFSLPPVDHVYDEEMPAVGGGQVFAMEYLPGQYDQRADSTAQCLQILTRQERPQVLTAKVIVLEGEISPAEFAAVKAYLINPVESREAALIKPETLAMETAQPENVPVLAGFITSSEGELQALQHKMGLAMSLADLCFCQAYFRDTEQRDPTETEIRVLDTYWSDHCRHTTFLTELQDVVIEPGPYTGPVAQAYQEYLRSRDYVYGDSGREICLMDIAVMAMKELRKHGLLDDLDESPEINACSIKVTAEIDGRPEPWLVMFKNETHNHPTEIEPFGGAATCLGGAIRDPLSGRAYVYQAMRVTGSGDPRTPVHATLPGKLPQRKITLGAAEGYSSYGNQIGLATGQVTEVYDPGFVAKRMELGAVIAAAPQENVVREVPQPGDVVLLVGGRTGRDGCGGATGSSKEHTVESLATCGAEVQKGDPPTERKIQRLFRNPAVSRLIKRCNDFGAGGVSVAIGELTDGLKINLDLVPKKYAGLNGTELAISESQERMAVVVAPENVPAFCAGARAENLEATPVAQVTANRRLQMFWRGRTIVDISRDFLNTNGVKQTARVTVTPPRPAENFFRQLPAAVAPVWPDLRQAWLANLQDLNVCSQKGLVERFDSTIGAATVLMPLGGRYQATPATGMVAKLPVLGGETTTATAMSFGYHPQLAKWSPFHGGMYAVVMAVANLVALGADYRQVRLTLQEYFEKLGQEPSRWGKPFSALLGAFYAQKQFQVAAIGGKDSMSGTFMDLHVPPTLVAFAVAVVDSARVISPEFKQAGSRVVLVPAGRDATELPDFAGLTRNFARVTTLIKDGKVLAAQTVQAGGLGAALSKMCFGNRLGVEVTSGEGIDWFSPDFGSLVLEIPAGLDLGVLFGEAAYRLLGHTRETPVITVPGMELPVTEALVAWEEPLEKIFPTRTVVPDVPPAKTAFTGRNSRRPAVKIARPRVLLPVFPGTNCEYDTARAFTEAGGLVDTLVIRNLTAADVEESISELVRRINQAQIIMLPGGFSAGDEPDGSGKFIAAMFRNPYVKEAVGTFLQQRDGLMLGICNGFQALIKLGLVPYGEIREITPECPTLTFNRIGRHVSCLVRTKVVSTLSPWFSNVEPGTVHTIAVSHGEGRFAASEAVVARLVKNGQIATQYVDADDEPTYDARCNPIGSLHAVEGITSPDGRILGKMGHSERSGHYVAVNVPGNKEQPVFAAGINYFR